MSVDKPDYLRKDSSESTLMAKMLKKFWGELTAIPKHSLICLSQNIQTKSNNFICLKIRSYCKEVVNLLIQNKISTFPLNTAEKN